MKVAAHPLVVAVALGLVGPGALEETGENETTNSRKPCAGCDESSHEPRDDGLSETIATRLLNADDGLHPTAEWTDAPAPSAEDFARVALAFERARHLI